MCNFYLNLGIIKLKFEWEALPCLFGSNIEEPDWCQTKAQYTEIEDQSGDRKEYGRLSMPVVGKT